jgi:alpha-tubulin suppressor-like RCC1 family protein
MKPFALWAPFASLVLSLIAASCGGAAAGGTFVPGPTGGGGGDIPGAGGATAGGTGGGIGFMPLQATSVALGAAHTCALLASGEVACWGDGSHGQLGDGTAGGDYHRAFAAKVPGLVGVTAIAAGGDTTCAIVQSGVMCWGDGAYGQLGDGTASDGYFQATPVPVQGLAHVKDLSVSSSDACAVAADGTVLCWGRNSPQGWLGFTSTDCGPYANTMNTVNQPCEPSPRQVQGVAQAVAVATGGDHTCALLSNTEVKCWGADEFGQLGDGFSGTQPHAAAPTTALQLVGAVGVAVGNAHSCAIMGSMHRVACWGDNSFGQLGIGTNALDSNKSAPNVILALDQVVDLGAAVNVTCAVLSGGTVRCWGDPAHLFPPDAGTTTTLPIAEIGVTGATSVRTGGSHACAVLTDHSVVCWGLDDRGQLGNNKLSLGDYGNAPVAAP